MGKAPRDTFGRSAKKPSVSLDFFRPDAQSGGPRFLAGPASSPKSSKKMDQGKRSGVGRSSGKKTSGKLFSKTGKKV